MVISMVEVKTNQMSVPIGSAPNPDPTVRTMELVDKGLDALRNELFIRFESVDKQFNANAEAIRIVKEDAVRVPTLLQTAITTVRELLTSADRTMEERLTGLINVHETKMNVLSDEREKRSAEQIRSAHTAVDAALAATKEAAAETKAVFVKQLDQLVQIMNATNAGLNGKVDDLKERMSKIESQIMTVDRSKDKSVALIGTVIAGVVGFVVVMTGVATVIAVILTRS
jgi:hypothetical protein